MRFPSFPGAGSWDSYDPCEPYDLEVYDDELPEQPLAVGAPGVGLEDSWVSRSARDRQEARQEAGRSVHSIREGPAERAGGLCSFAGWLEHLFPAASPDRRPRLLHELSLFTLQVLEARGYRPEEISADQLAQAVLAAKELWAVVREIEETTP